MGHVRVWKLDPFSLTGHIQVDLYSIIFMTWHDTNTIHEHDLPPLVGSIMVMEVRPWKDFLFPNQKGVIKQLGIGAKFNTYHSTRATFIVGKQLCFDIATSSIIVVGSQEASSSPTMGRASYGGLVFTLCGCFGAIFLMWWLVCCLPRVWWLWWAHLWLLACDSLLTCAQ